MISKKIDYEGLKDTVQNESVYQIYQKQKLTESEKIRLCLCGGLFKNVVKRMNNDMKYMLINDGGIVEIDNRSAISHKQNYADYLIFSEL